MSNATASDISELQAANQVLNKTVDKLTQELELFKFKYEQLQQYIYGKKSEKQFLDDSSQLNIFGGNNTEPDLEPADQDDYLEVNYKSKKRVSKKSFPKDLPVDEVEYLPTESNCADCGTELKEFSRDIREEIEFQPARFLGGRLLR